MVNEGYKPLDRASLLRLKELGYVYLYFDENDPVEDWIDDSTPEGAAQLDKMFGPADPGFLVAVPVKERKEDLDRWNWLCVAVDSAEAEDLIEKEDREIMIEAVRWD